MQIIRSIISSPLFWFGVFLRLLVIDGFLPAAIYDWYVPFLDKSMVILSIDPWGDWISAGGRTDAFPYGYIMWLAFVPALLVTGFLGLPSEFAYIATIFLADVGLLVTLLKLVPSKLNFVLAVYWLSPVVIFTSYALGFNDLIPASLLLLAILFLRRNQIFISTAFLVLSISAKLSMLVALPFIVIYLYNNKAHRRHMKSLVLSTVIFGLALTLPFISSESAMTMLFGNPEMTKAFHLSLSLGNNIEAYILPLLYLSLLYLGWRVRPLNFELFTILIGVSFLMIVLLTPGSPGWLIWAIPFLTIYQSKGDKIAVTLAACFSLSYIIHIVLITALVFDENAIYDFSLLPSYDFANNTLIMKFIQTGILFTGVLMAVRMWREEVTRSDFFRFNEKPITIGISGDSGAGKDTLMDAIENLIGAHSVVKLSGDDYHRWDRNRPMWQVMTHTNPMANDLQSFSNDLFKLISGKSISQRHYDHTTGKMTKPFVVKSNQFVLASGLHTLYLPMVRNICDLKIFLDIDEDLRRFFKIRRDVHERGHTLDKVLKSLADRLPDAQKFIQPQSKHADVKMALCALNDEMLKDTNNYSTPKLKLSVTIRNSYDELALYRVLVGFCGLHVDLVSDSNSSEVMFTIEGESSAEDMAQAAYLLSPRTLGYLDEQPVWHPGILGIMQLIIFSQINQLITTKS